MANYFVFRVDYDEYFPFIYEELKQGRLRQGWGGPNMDVRNPFDEFTAAWEKWSPFSENMKRRYNMLRIMLEIKEGDLIVIPKVSMQQMATGRYFTIVKCRKPYEFTLSDGKNDFGHYIEVEPLVSCSYDSSGAAQVLSSYFGKYRRAVNRILDEGVMDAIDVLIMMRSSATQSSPTRLGLLSAETCQARDLYLKELVEKMQSWQNAMFEKVIESLFVQNGYIKVSNNCYDGEGGDVDLVFKAFSERSLMYDIYTKYEDDIMPEIYIQAKKKRGHDSNDVAGVRQLIQMAKKDKKAKVLILINLTDKFSAEAQELADQEHVVLLNGVDFASMLVRHGLENGVGISNNGDEV